VGVLGYRLFHLIFVDLFPSLTIDSTVPGNCFVFVYESYVRLQLRTYGDVGHFSSRACRRGSLWVKVYIERVKCPSC
jgi:hypothetical protein